MVDEEVDMIERAFVSMIWMPPSYRQMDTGCAGWEKTLGGELREQARRKFGKERADQGKERVPRRRRVKEGRVRISLVLPAIEPVSSLSYGPSPSRQIAIPSSLAALDTLRSTSNCHTQHPASTTLPCKAYQAVVELPSLKISQIDVSIHRTTYPSAKTLTAQ